MSPYNFSAVWDGPIRHQVSEVASGGWLTVPELRARLADPDWPVVPDGRVGIDRWLASHPG